MSPGGPGACSVLVLAREMLLGGAVAEAHALYWCWQGLGILKNGLITCFPPELPAHTVDKCT